MVTSWRSLASPFQRARFFAIWCRRYALTGLSIALMAITRTLQSTSLRYVSRISPSARDFTPRRMDESRADEAIHEGAVVAASMPKTVD